MGLSSYTVLSFRFVFFRVIRWIRYARIMRQPVAAEALEAAIVIGSSLSTKNAIEIVARNTPKYRLALLRTKLANSVIIVLEYLAIKINMKAMAKKPVIIVYVSPVR